MKQVYQADDGTIFDTEADCKEYENGNALHDLIEEHINVSYNDDVGFHCIEVSDVKTFIEQNIDDIIRIVKGEAVTSTSDDGWISNKNRRLDCHPINLEFDTLIEVKYRCGATNKGTADSWEASWKSTDNDPYDIIAYRIVT